MDFYGFFIPLNLRFKRYSYSITVLKNKKTSLPTTMLGRVSTNQEVAIHERGRMQ